MSTLLVHYQSGAGHASTSRNHCRYGLPTACHRSAPHWPANGAAGRTWYGSRAGKASASARAPSNGPIQRYCYCFGLHARAVVAHADDDGGVDGVAATAAAAVRRYGAAVAHAHPSPLADRTSHDHRQAHDRPAPVPFESRRRNFC